MKTFALIALFAAAFAAPSRADQGAAGTAPPGPALEEMLARPSGGPDTVAGHLARAAAHERLGETEEALDAIKAALAFHPANMEAIGAQTAALLRAHRTAEALGELAGHLDKMPESAFLHSLRSEALFLRGRHEDSLFAATRAIELAPELMHAYFQRGRAAQATDRDEQAIADLRHYLKAAPGHAEAHYRLGLALMSAGALGAAERAFERAAQRDAGLAVPAAYQKALLDARRGRLAQAQEAFQDLFESLAGDGPATPIQAQVYRSLWLVYNARQRMELSAEINQALTRADARSAERHLQALLGED